MRIKNPILLSLLIWAAVQTSWVYAKGADQHVGSHSAGLGLILGEPTGFTGHYRLTPDSTLHGGLAFSFSDFFLVYGDYIFEFPAPAKLPADLRKTLTPYVGIGALLLFSTDTYSRRGAYFSTSSSVGMGFRIPLGLEWNPVGKPLGIFAELVPGLGFVPATFGFIQGGVGVVYYLN